MRTMYVSESKTHVHNDYIIGHHHTLLKIIAEKVFYYIKMSKISTESLTQHSHKRDQSAEYET
jgi:hypothetical protein